MKYKRELRDLTSYVQKRVMEFRQQRPSDTTSVPESFAIMHPPAVKAQRFPSFELPEPAAVVPQEPAPTDFYKAEDFASYKSRRSQLVGHVAHAVGSAATLAAHSQSTPTPAPFHPYIQGSLMTRGPIN